MQGLVQGVGIGRKVRVQGAGCRVQGLVQGVGIGRKDRVQGAGCRVRVALSMKYLVRFLIPVYR